MKKLIKKCKELDREAQREMVNYLSPFLYAICCRYSSSKEENKDLLQESLILIFNNIENFTSDEEYVFKSWCRRIAINNALAKKRKKTLDIERGDVMIMTTRVSPVVESNLNVEDILIMLKSLPKNQRMVFNLYVIDGYSHKEIGQLLNIKESSSRTFLTRARQALQQLIYEEQRA